MSDTPRTDLQTLIRLDPRDERVHAAFARVLEGENNDLRAELDAIEKAIVAILKERQNIINDRLGIDQHAFATGHLSACDRIERARREARK